jgi:hypothetical protein
MKVLIEAKADVDCVDVNGDRALFLVLRHEDFHSQMLLLMDHHGGTRYHSSDTETLALGVVLDLEREFAVPEQSVAFMLLAHGADIDVAYALSELASDKNVAESYADTHLFIERWHEIALNALSERVEVDRRVGLGLHGLYQEPLERVLQYLGLSMAVDQVVNSSLDDDDGVKRALLPNCAHNANHWFHLHQYHRKCSCRVQ